MSASIIIIITTTSTTITATSYSRVTPLLLLLTILVFFRRSEKKAAKALDNPFGKYTNFGQLICHPLQSNNEQGQKGGIGDAYPTDAEAGHDSRYSWSDRSILNLVIVEVRMIAIK